MKPIKLLTKDEVTFDVDAEIAQQSVMIKTLLEGKFNSRSHI